MLNVIQFVCVILDSYYKWNIFGQFFISNLFNVFPHFNVTLFLHILTHLDFTNCTFVVVPLDKFSQCIYFLFKKKKKKEKKIFKKIPHSLQNKIPLYEIFPICKFALYTRLHSNIYETKTRIFLRFPRSIFKVVL